MRGQLPECFPVRQHTGFEGRVHAVVAAGHEHLAGERRLHGRLPAAQRHPAPGLPIKRGVPHDGIHDFAHAHGSAAHPQRPVRALVRARPATPAGSGPIHAMGDAGRSGLQAVKPFRTHRNARPARRTAFGLEQDFRARGLTLRIGAPPAAQGAPLEEHQRARPRPVVDGIPLHIEDNPAHTAPGIKISRPGIPQSGHPGRGPATGSAAWCG